MERFSAFYERYKMFILGFGVFLVLSAAYLLFFRNRIIGTDALLQSATVRTEDEELRDELLSLIADLQHITFDERLFEDERFKLLRDFTVELLPQPAGRSNPFLPLGAGGSASDTLGRGVF